MRTYVSDVESATRAVQQIVSLVKNGTVDPLISFDVETMPIPGLEGYPGTTFDDAGEPIKPAKKDYLVFSQERWFDSFNPEKLAQLGLVVPTKTTSGNERPGIPAKTAWAAFWERLQQIELAQLEECRWSVLDFEDFSQEVVNRIGFLQQEIAEQTGKRGKKGYIDGLKRELEQRLWQENRLETAKERLKTPLDVRLLRRFVGIGVENRITKDPVRPGLDPYTSEIFTLQVSLRPVDRSQEVQTWVFNTHLIDIRLLKPIFTFKSEKYRYIAHNAQFDLKLLMFALGFKAVPKNIYCTRVASRCLYLGLKMSHALKACLKRHFNVDLDKGVRDTFIGRRREEPTAEQIEYGAFDTEWLFPLYDIQQQIAAERGQTQLLDTFSKLSWITAKWTLEGYRIDQARWLEIAKEAATARDKAADELEQMLLPEGYAEYVGGTLFPTEQSVDDIEDDEDVPVPDNNDSLYDVDDDDSEDSYIPKDVRKLAVIRISQRELVLQRLRSILSVDFDSVDWPANSKKEKKPSLGKIGRGALERKYREVNGGETHPFFKMYDLWSKRAKQASTYGRTFLWYIHPLTGCVHPSFGIGGTDTLRYTSRFPNVLNIPAAKEEGDPDFRSAFLSVEGNLLLGADFDAMELRIAFDVTQDDVGKAMVESGKDGHTFTAAMAFHLREGTNERTVTERFRYGTTDYDIPVTEYRKGLTTADVVTIALGDELTAKVKAVPQKITRTVAKSVTFLYLFGGAAFTLAQRTGLPVQQCELFFERFEQGVYPKMSAGMMQFRKDVWKTVFEGADGKEYAYATAYGGVRRYFELPKAPSRSDFPQGWAGNGAFFGAQKEYKRRLRKIEREAGNIKCQGGNAIITAEALVRLTEEGCPMGIYPWLAIYDEIIMTFLKVVSLVVVKDLLETAMLESAANYMTFVPAGAEADLNKVGERWVKS